jgi:hypothetical protein
MDKRIKMYIVPCPEGTYKKVKVTQRWIIFMPFAKRNGRRVKGTQRTGIYFFYAHEGFLGACVLKDA